MHSTVHTVDILLALSDETLRFRTVGYWGKIFSVNLSNEYAAPKGNMVSIPKHWPQQRLKKSARGTSTQMSLSVEEKRKDLSMDPEFIVDFSYLTLFAPYLLFLFSEEGYGCGVRTFEAKRRLLFSKYVHRASPQILRVSMRLKWDRVYVRTDIW